MLTHICMRTLTSPSRSLSEKLTRVLSANKKSSVWVRESSDRPRYVQRNLCNVSDFSSCCPSANQENLGKYFEVLWRFLGKERRLLPSRPWSLVTQRNRGKTSWVKPASWASSHTQISSAWRELSPNVSQELKTMVQQALGIYFSMTLLYNFI